MKTVERQHLPSQLWETIELDKNLPKALEQIDEHLKYWPKFLINKNKQRLLRITQYLIRMRKLKLKPQVKRRRIDTKLERREKVREEKAEKIALIDNKIKSELLERLKQGAYGDMYPTFRTEVWNQVLDQEEVSDEMENEDEFVADDYEDEDDEARYAEYGGFSSGEDEEDDLEDFDSFQEPPREEKSQEKPVRKEKKSARDEDEEGFEERPRPGQLKRKRGDTSKGRKHIEVEYDQGEREKATN
jgi:protein MAK16